MFLSSSAPSLLQISWSAYFFHLKVISPTSLLYICNFSYWQRYYQAPSTIWNRPQITKTNTESFNPALFFIWQSTRTANSNISISYEDKLSSRPVDGRVNDQKSKNEILSPCCIIGKQRIIRTHGEHWIQAIDHRSHSPCLFFPVVLCN